MQQPLLFTLAVLAVLGTPGPTNTLLALSGAARGVRRSLALIPAEAAGYTITILTVGLLLGPVLATQSRLTVALRIVVGLYLLWLAMRLWRRGATPAAGAPVTPGQIFVATLLNPKAVVFAVAIIPFGTAPVWPYLLGFLGLLMTVAAGWIGLGAALGAAAARGGAQRWITRAGAAVLGTFALLLVATLFVGRA